MALFERFGSRGDSGMYRNSNGTFRDLNGTLWDAIGTSIGVKKTGPIQKVDAPQIPPMGPIYPVPDDKRYTLAAFHAIHKANIAFQTAREIAYQQMMVPQLTDCGPDCNRSGLDGAPRSVSTPFWSIGSFAVAAVPFSVSELTPDHNFRKSYSPTPEQRFWAEWYMIKRSWNIAQERGARVVTSAHSTGHQASCKEMAELKGVLTQWDNFGMNPIPPTESEWKDVGGYAKWIARGGYPLVKDCLEGKADLGTGGREAIAFEVCISPLCLCANNPQMPVACQRSQIVVDGRQASFWLRIKIDPRTNGKFHMLLDYAEPSKLKKFGEVMAKILDKIASIVCGNQQKIAQQQALMVTNQCVDRFNKPCMRGTFGCNCMQPSSAAVGGVVLYNTMAAGMCAALAKENAAPPLYVPPATSPWPWVIGGVIVIGGLLYARNR